MKPRLLGALPLAALIMLVGCQTNPNAVSELEKQYYQGCATTPAADPSCGHH